nr:HAMP domain-containing sensor histidine kinase [Aquisediminimonas sediminicola]
MLIDVTTVQWAYLGLLIAFTICLGLMTQLTASSGLRWWLASNLTTAIAFPLFILRSEIPFGNVVFLLPTTLVIVSAALKLLAVIPAAQRRRRAWHMAMLVALFMAVYKLLDQAGWLAARLSFSLGTLSLLTLLIAHGASRNTRWRGIQGRGVLIISFTVSGVILAGLSARALGGNESFAYFSQGMAQSIAFGLNLLQLLLVHIGFIAVVIGRLTRVTVLKGARERELIRRRRLAEERGREMEAIAQERHALLELLTHEVRQPLNNAQAALQEISRTIDGQRLAALGMSQPVARLYDIIDQVVLALSNAIVAASLIERKSRQNARSVDLAEVAELAKGDCPLTAHGRITLLGADCPMFIQGDPVLLRLAFRNLLDNAIKFSAPETPITVKISVDEDRLGMIFEVRNIPTRPFTPDRALFERALRGDVSIEGSGLGLFIVREVSLIHEGTVDSRVASDGQTVFEMFFPA